jgi:ribosomal protein S18 acetylase RimI-like enzyme
MPRLLNMNPEEAKTFLASQAQRYAQDISESQDITIEKARKIVASERESLSVNDDNEHFFYVADGAANVGQIWLTVRNKEALFISYIEIFQEFRGKGYGTQAMKLIEQQAKTLGCNQIWLHVFASNTVARALYSKAGFRESGVRMFKKLESS